MNRPSTDEATLREIMRALEPVIKDICKIGGTPGISLAVSYHGKAIHRTSYGFRDLEAQKPVDGSTQFPIGTMAKAFTAAAVGSLVAEGKLEWDTPIKSIIPELQTRIQTVSENLTIVDLLSQRSGLGRSDAWWQGSDAALLLEKKDLVALYNTLPLTGQFRGNWCYSNWAYALAGEVIERLSGKTYAQYLEEKVYKPLGLKNTTMKAVKVATNLAMPYAAMDNASPHLMPQPPINGDTIMAPAMGGTSSADDLLAFNIALLQAFRHETSAEKSSTVPAIKNALMQLSGHIFIERAALEKSYAFGWYRTQFPNTILGMGCNAIHVKNMPRIVPRSHVGPLIAHSGSLPGYQVAMALLPEINSSVVVCTNSIALGDVSGWVAMALIEALVDMPNPSDYRALAIEAAGNAALNVKNLVQKLDDLRTRGTKPRLNSDYVGRYCDDARRWIIVVRTKSGGGLEVVFQGLKSQAWELSHYEHDTFLWLAPREEQAKRGRMVNHPMRPDQFKIVFRASQGYEIDRLLWAHEIGAPLDQQCFIKRK